MIQDHDVPGRGIEPPPLTRFDFESNAATNYAIRAKVLHIIGCIQNMEASDKLLGMTLQTQDHPNLMHKQFIIFGKIFNLYFVEIVTSGILVRI